MAHKRTTHRPATAASRALLRQRIVEAIDYLPAAGSQQAAISLARLDHGHMDVRHEDYVQALIAEWERQMAAHFMSAYAPTNVGTP